MFKFIKRLFGLVLTLLICVALLYCYARYIEPFSLKTETVSIRSPHLSSNSNGLKIAVFADTHFSEYYTPEDFHKVVTAVNEARPDLIVFAGDLIDHYSEYTGDISEISDQLAEMKATYGKFAVYGNHDYGGGAELVYEKIMNAGGFSVLVNDYSELPQAGVSLVGINDALISYADPAAAGLVSPDSFNIVICHEPDIADQILDYNVDLMLSAHTHGRQINLRFFDEYILPSYGKKYVKGQFSLPNERQTQLYVNRGLGMTKLPFRFLSKPELTIITVNS